jgi:hypothetical protein
LDGRSRPGLMAPLALDEANTLLREGGYGLRLERARSGELRLAGTGVGEGLPLGSEPTWADLYRALVRLRRTRLRHDPGWLRRLTRFIEGKQPEDVPGLVRLASHRVEPLIAPGGQALEAFETLMAADGSVLFPAEAADRPAGRIPIADSTAELQGEIGGVRLDREQALQQLHGWSRLSSAVEEDPLLRMHCATQPVPAALVDTETGAAVLVRDAEPAPPHPKHPGGTVVASQRALLRPGPDGTPTLLRQVVENRFERREDELDYFLEHLIRPLLRTFRLALDAHRIGLYSLDAAGIGFELSPEFQATGRVVICDYGRVRAAEAESAEVRAGVAALVGTLDALSEGFRLIEFSGGDHGHSNMRAAVDRVMAEELRYLEEHTAAVLGHDQRLQALVHTVPSAQDAVLKEVVHTVQERTRSRRRNGQLPQPTVVVDLDLCGIVPLQRTLDAARAVSGPRVGAPEGICELARPHVLRVLPTYAESTWHHFVEGNGLDERYPLVDWRQVYLEFFRAFARPWEKLRTDTVNAGLARFVWDVQDAGGRVVFCTGRRERVRKYTQEVLAAAGVPDCVLLCMPDHRTRPISELKVEKLRELGELDVVAVFDDMQANRIAITKEFSGALAVAVEIPGLATERHPDQPVPDRAPVIATFETSPRPVPTRRVPAGPRLSHAHSLEELQVGALRTNRLVHRWAVHLTEAESADLVDAVMSDVDRSGERTGRGARAKFGIDHDLDEGERRDRTIRALHHVFSRKQFLKGSRSHYQPADMDRDAAPFVQRGQPIDVVLLGFPIKQSLNRLKAFGPLPDLAEFGGIARLRELQQAARVVYPPGLQFRILTDGRHFRPRPAAITGAYSRKLREYADLVGIGDRTTIEEIDEVARRRLGPELPDRRSTLVARYRQVLCDALRDFDITNNPLRTLESIDTLASEVDGPEALVQDLGLFREMLMSVVYSVPVPNPAGTDRITWSSLVYADVYNLADHTVSHEVCQARAAVLRRAWHTVVRYLATLRVDEELEYEKLFPDRVRLTVSAARPGRCGFTYLGGSGLLPWQGTGALDPRGQVAVDFAVSMLDQGFIPVYSTLLGPRQPWLMVPPQHTRLRGRGSVPGIRLDEGFVQRARLRRR